MSSDDALSRWWMLHPVRADRGARCRVDMPWQVDTPWRVEHPTPGRHVVLYHFVVEGGAQVDIDGQERRTLEAGDLLVLPHGHAHRICAWQDAGGNAQARSLSMAPSADLLCGQFYVDEPGSQTLIEAMPDVMIVNTSEDARLNGLQVLVSLIQTETMAARPGSGAVVSHLASALFLQLIRAWLDQGQTMPGVLSLLAHPRLGPAMSAALTEPGRPWTLDELAAISQMSRATFKRSFLSVSGQPPGEVLRGIRMKQAARWLRQGTMNLEEVGEVVGYRSTAAFHRAFKRQFGVGPGEFRRTGAQASVSTQ